MINKCGPDVSADMTCAIALPCPHDKQMCVLLLNHSSQCSLYRGMYLIVTSVSYYVSHYVK